MSSLPPPYGPQVLVESVFIVISFNAIFRWLNYILRHEDTTNGKYEKEQLINPKHFFIDSYAFISIVCKVLVVFVFCVCKVLFEAQLVPIAMPINCWKMCSSTYTNANSSTKSLRKIVKSI